jgi:hypothetical protein
MPSENEMGTSSTLSKIIYLIAAFFVIVFIGYIAVFIASNYYSQDDTQKAFLAAILGQFTVIGSQGWEFIKPFLQLVLILAIVDWIFSKLGVSLKSKVGRLEWNIQTVIALVVIGSFAIAALGGLNAGISSLKDLALVVIGFYFGTQRKSVEVQPDGKVTVVQEHDNDVKIQTKELTENKPKEK